MDIKSAAEGMFQKDLESALGEVFPHGEVHVFDQIDSTNAAAGNLALNGAPEGSIVVAESQSHGKGRLGRGWHSPPGKGIYLSLVLRPSLEPGKISLITLAAAIALMETFIFFDPSIEAEIKWPNDILAGGKKIAGILTEMTAEENVVHYIILGTGINIHHSKKDFIKDIQDIATSFFIETGKEISRTAFIQKYIEMFEPCYQNILKENTGVIIEKFIKYSRIIGKNIMVDTASGSIKGEVQKVNPDGSLEIKNNAGAVIEILAGDVTYRNQ